MQLSAANKRGLARKGHNYQTEKSRDDDKGKPFTRARGSDLCAVVEGIDPPSILDYSTAVPTGHRVV